MSISIPTTHVGSLVRPKELIPFIRAMEAGESYDEAAYEKTLRDAVHTVVAQQVKAGVDIVSDGEFGKSIAWAFYVISRLGGFELRPFPPGMEFRQAIAGTDHNRFPEFYDEYTTEHQEINIPGTWVSTGPISYTGTAELKRDIDNLKSAAEAAGAKSAFLPVVAPGSAFPMVSDEYYGDDQAFYNAVADALRVEYETILDSGLDIQVDDAFLPYMWDMMGPSGMTLDAFKAFSQIRIDALNRALDGLPEDRIRYHLCWGSWNGPHTADIPLRDVIDLVLQVNAGIYSFEAANPRHEHEYRVWGEVDLPERKKLAPGLISHATNIVEHPELIAERIERFAAIVGPERLMASTDCGFAQAPFVSRVHPTIVWAKLEALAEGRDLALDRLLATSGR